VRFASRCFLQRPTLRRKWSNPLYGDCRQSQEQPVDSRPVSRNLGSRARGARSVVHSLVHCGLLGPCFRLSRDRGQMQVDQRYLYVRNEPGDRWSGKRDSNPRPSAWEASPKRNAHNVQADRQPERQPGDVITSGDSHFSFLGKNMPSPVAMQGSDVTCQALEQ